MDLPPLSVCERIQYLHAQLGSDNENIKKTAMTKLLKYLNQHKLTWNDLPQILAVKIPSRADRAKTSQQKATSQGPQQAPDINVLDLVLRLVELHIAVTPEERMAIALWILHTYVFEQFSITPRLALLSPVRGCGKTTLLILLELLVAKPFRSDNVTAAAIYHTLAYQVHVLLIDEGDNLGLLNNNILRAVFNAGHRRGGHIDRLVSGRPWRFSVFAPLAIAAIGLLPLPLMHRSIIIYMRRYAPSEVELQRLDESDPSFPATRDLLQKWAATCTLAQDRTMTLREGDNWRVLLAIADALGHGEAARAAEAALNAGRMDEDPGVKLLTDIRAVFDTNVIDRIWSAALVETLVAFEDGFWNEWRGLRDDRVSRKLTQGELARLLRMFTIRPRTVRIGKETRQGYYRHQFEAAWRAYCSAANTSTQPSKIKHLHKPRSNT